MIERLLIANRGEIACRVARTARRLGVRTIAVHSDADAGALHVAACDEAWAIGGAAARDSYLRIDRILDVARRAGAQAIHPGYGFLSENEAFAQACADAGIVFVGPPPAAIRAMGSKSRSKEIMADAGVPLVPGYHGEDQDTARLADEARRIGFPVLIKASAGGGGKGMRIVERAEAFGEALASAQREAASSFGDARVLIEKYLVRPRHVEVQVFADTHGNAVHLFERDCSVQRRHQKVLEEAPAPGLGAEKRRQMGSAAVAAARAVDYVGAGTVEFILDASGTFHFMEMNTRLQVEHPVTEMITGLDLVEWQLRVAAGEPLPKTQEQLAIRGHAVEARIYAEDPDRGFVPSIGRLAHLREPAASAFVRVDTGVREGDEIGVHYDPMIAKLVCWDVDRDAALRRLRLALAQYQVVGPVTNLDFLARVVAHPAFAQAHRDPTTLDTGLIETHREALFPPKAAVPDTALACVALAELLHAQAEARTQALRSRDPWSPWHATDGWRLNADHRHTLRLLDGASPVAVTVHFGTDGRHALDLPGGRVQASASAGRHGALEAVIDGTTLHATVVRDGARRVVFTAAGRFEVALELRETGVDAEVGGSLVAPMPGSVIDVLVTPGTRVDKGTPLLILEAMKMQHTITAPRAGVVGEIYFTKGEQVTDGATLIALEAAEAVAS
ncbi:MAG: acetyl/propionyl/methylcrotonyl-CoA carboxylase subunit alpha [Burkholderiales bacterium]|jgi:3-methylcrotonyl-CoA carboxylase alpha subunit|nr:acetyl/propionyl/methylcrotonyl-CoA carboxylase subunit alpha [Burkholderiales bacterium]